MIFTQLGAATGKEADSGFRIGPAITAGSLMLLFFAAILYIFFSS